MKNYDITKENSNASPITNPLYNFAGIAASSAILQPFITSAWTLMIQKMRSGKTYPEAFTELRQTSFGTFLQNSKNIYVARTFASMLPASASGAIVDIFDLSKPISVASNTALESLISFTQEPKIRFDVTHQSAFPLKSFNHSLYDISEKHFNRLKPENYNGKSYQDLEILRKTFAENRLYQLAAILARNSLFSSAVFLAKPFAQNFVAENGQYIKENYEIPESVQTELMTTTFRLSLAFLTTPFDRALTQMSSGEKTFPQFLKDLTIKNSFQGAMARSVFCFLTATTIAKGLELAPSIKEFIETDPAINFVISTVVRANREKIDRYGKQQTPNSNTQDKTYFTNTSLNNGNEEQKEQKTDLPDHYSKLGIKDADKQVTEKNKSFAFTKEQQGEIEKSFTAPTQDDIDNLEKELNKITKLYHSILPEELGMANNKSMKEQYKNIYNLLEMHAKCEAQNGTQNLNSSDLGNLDSKKTNNEPSPTALALDLLAKPNSANLQNPSATQTNPSETQKNDHNKTQTHC